MRRNNNTSSNNTTGNTVSLGGLSSSTSNNGTGRIQRAETLNLRVAAVITQVRYAPESKDGTVVTWAMFGPSPFLSKVMSLFASMDKMVGSKYEEGLSNLKNLAEK